MTQRRTRRWTPWTAVAVVLLGAVVAWVFSTRPPNGSGELAEELVDRGRLGLLGAPDLRDLRAEGTELVPIDGAVRAALQGDDPQALGEAMDAAGLAGLLVDGRSPRPLSDASTVEERLHAYGYVPSLRGVYLAPAAALYLRAEHPEVRGEVGAAAARVARGVVAGRTPPRVTIFPEPLRRIGSVEVMVLLRQAGRPRLWRSARGSSIARALVTAAVVARQRWQERQQAMGGTLDAALPHLDVEVSLLLDDGVLGSRRANFLDRAITPRHGVAYERTGAWRYLLPRATRRAGEGSAARAYAQLFEDSGLPADSLNRSDLRLYRLAMARVGVSRAPRPRRPRAAPDAGVSPEPPATAPGSGSPLPSDSAPGSDHRPR